MNSRLSPIGSKTTASEEVGTKQDIQLDLELLLENYTTGKTREQIQQEIAHKGTEIHALVFRDVVQNVLPGIARQLGPVTHPEDVETNTKTNISSHRHISEKQNAFHNALQIKVAVEADKPVTAAQALYMSRGGIANAIADDFLNALRSRYLGKHSLKTKSTFDLHGDEVISHDMEIDEEPTFKN